MTHIKGKPKSQAFHKPFPSRPYNRRGMLLAVIHTSPYRKSVMTPRRRKTALNLTGCNRMIKRQLNQSWVCTNYRIFVRRFKAERVLGSIVVSIPACHAGDRGSIPRRGDFLFNPHDFTFLPFLP